MSVTSAYKDCTRYWGKQQYCAKFLKVILFSRHFSDGGPIQFSIPATSTSKFSDPSLKLRTTPPKLISFLDLHFPASFSPAYLGFGCFCILTEKNTQHYISKCTPSTTLKKWKLIKERKIWQALQIATQNVAATQNALCTKNPKPSWPQARSLILHQAQSPRPFSSTLYQEGFFFPAASFHGNASVTNLNKCGWRTPENLEQLRMPLEEQNMIQPSY